jgi:hypothetical protein
MSKVNVVSKALKEFIMEKIREMDMEILSDMESKSFKDRVARLAKLEQKRQELLGKNISIQQAQNYIVQKIIKHIASAEFRENNYSRSKSRSSSHSKTKRVSTYVLHKGVRGGQYYIKNNRKIYV